mgnify:CR=1 FL=1
MNDVVQIVSTLGFPIAMCIGACFFIKYLFDSFTKQQEEMRMLLERQDAEGDAE